MDQRNQKPIIFEAESDYEYFRDTAISDCHEKLQMQIEAYLKSIQINDPSQYTLSPVEDEVEKDIYVDEYICKCRQKLTLH